MNPLRVFVVLLAVPAVARAGDPLNTEFLYSGQLKQAGVPVDGTCDFALTLWDNNDGGVLLDDFQSLGVPVVQGLFSV